MPSVFQAVCRACPRVGQPQGQCPPRRHRDAACGARTARARDCAACGAVGASPMWTTTATAMTTPRPSSACARWRSHPPGRTCGSARIRWATCRRPGIDAAGRKQYLYHAAWREHRDRAKFTGCSTSAAPCPGCDGESSPISRRRSQRGSACSACAVRLLDVGLFRIGSEEYAEDDGGLGLATLRREHVTVHPAPIVFDYPAKSGARRRQVIDRPGVVRAVATLKRRRRAGGDELLAYRERPALASDSLRRHQRLPQAASRRGLQRQGLPHLERHGDGRGVAAAPRPRGVDQDGAKASDGSRRAEV